MRLVLSDGVVKEIPVRVPGVGDTAIIDWLNFTVNAETAWNLRARTPASRDMVIALGVKLAHIFGFNVTKQCEKGRNFYRQCYQLGDDTQKYGFVMIGGQNNTICVMVNGSGLTAAADGWERRLYEFLKHEAVGPRITRIDLAHDDFFGERYSVDRADEDYMAGLYTCHNMTPEYERRGSWRRITGKGRSFYVGHRRSGKYLRVYEKGMQLGQKGSPWVRIEVEFKNIDRVLVPEMLLHPGEYLAAAYPALNWLQEKQTRIETYSREVEASHETLEGWMHRQCGGALDWLVKVEQARGGEGAVERVFERIRRDSIPARMAKYVIHNDDKPMAPSFPEHFTVDDISERAYIINASDKYRRVGLGVEPVLNEGNENELRVRNSAAEGNRNGSRHKELQGRH
jgi:phage replication initiation protein